MRRYSAHLGYLFNDLPLEERFAAASHAHFSDVEHPSLYAISADRVKGLCEENGLSLVQIALPTGEVSRGEKGLAALPGREADFRASVRTGLDYARAVGSQFVHVMSGVRPAGMSVDEVCPTYIANLRHACAAAADVGIPVLIEPIGVATLADYVMGHPDLALRALAEVDSRNLSILFDAFHARNAGIDPVAFVQENHSTISHVHIADHPGRHEPGTGALDFQALFGALDAASYRGAVGLEYVPLDDTISGLAWRQVY